MEPTPPDEEPRRSRFEDLSDIQVPGAAPGGRQHRPAIVTTAAVVLFVAALMNGIVALLLSPEGTGLWVSAALSVAQAIGALLIVLLIPFGRSFGIVLGTVGVVMGLVVAVGGAPESGLVTMGLNGFVIYALAASGPSFRRG